MREVPVITTIKTPAVLRVFVVFSNPYRTFAARYLECARRLPSKELTSQNSSD
jgi:hypothetical protein